jgi:hypothetical protein
MRYAILCYADEDEALAHAVPNAGAAGRRPAGVRSVLWMMPSTTAVTVRATHRPPLVLDGPCEEAALDLIGLCVVERGCLNDALDAAEAFAIPGLAASYEIRPVREIHGASAMTAG